MTDLTQDQLVADLTRDLVAKISPEELPLFRAISEEYFKNPEKMPTDGAGKDEMLGFGTGEAVTLLTPTVLVVMTEVIKFIRAEVQKSIKEESASLINEAIKKMFKKFHPKEEKADAIILQPLRPEQLEQVRQLAFNRALQLKFSEAKARSMADVVVGSLAAAPS